MLEKFATAKHLFSSLIITVYIAVFKVQRHPEKEMTLIRSDVPIVSLESLSLFFLIKTY